MSMPSLRRITGAVGVALVCLGWVARAAQAQEPAPTQPVEIPPSATVLEGVPTSRVDAAEGTTTRHVLDQAEAAKSRLRVTVKDGQYYWTSRDNRLLRLNSSGAFTYLSADPGQYIRFTRINDRITYVEHVDTALGSVTWWGEMKIVVGAQPRR
jgi:hypothetical protein